MEDVGRREGGIAAAGCALVIAAALVACGTPGGQAPMPTQRLSPAPAVAPSPVQTPSPPSGLPSETPLPGEAILAGQVLDAQTQVPVGGALVKLEPYALETLSDSDGRVMFRKLLVPGRCRWVTITVRANGYGELKTVDNALFPGRAVVTLFLETSDSVKYIGPPSSEPDGKNMCVR